MLFAIASASLSSKNRVQRRGPEPASSCRASGRCRNRHAVPAFSHARSLVRAVLPEVQTTCRLGRRVETTSATRRCTASMDALDWTFVATKKGMSAALAYAADKNSDSSHIVRSADTGRVQLLERAVATGEIRGDISPETAACPRGQSYMHDQPAGRPACCGSSVFIDGCVSGAIQKPLSFTPVASFARPQNDVNVKSCPGGSRFPECLLSFAR